MAFLIVNSGLEEMALVKLGARSFSQWYMGLYSNIWTPGLTDTLANYTLGGYAVEVAVVNTSWAGSVSGGIFTSTAAPVNFTLASGYGGSYIIGYYIRNSGSTLIGAEEYAVPFAVPSGGGNWTVALQDVFQ